MAEALRLADELRAAPERSRTSFEAAAELRRLHAENERIGPLAERVLELKAQRDALLETLKYIAKQFRQHGRQHWPEAVAARLAIEAVEGEKT